MEHYPQGATSKARVGGLGPLMRRLTCINSLVQMTRHPCLSHLPVFQLLPVLETLERGLQKARAVYPAVFCL